MGDAIRPPLLLISIICTVAKLSHAAGPSSDADNITARTASLTNIRQLADGFDAAISPDGQEVAFTKDYAIWLIGIDGGNQHKIIDRGAKPAWSPDGTKIMFVDRGERFTERLSVYDIKASKTAAVTTASVSDSHVAWSRDAKHLFLYEVTADDTQDVLSFNGAVDLDSLQMTRPDRERDASGWLSKNTILGVHPKIRFTTPHTGDLGLWVVGRDNEFSRNTLQGYWDDVEVSPDHSTLVFAQVVSGSRPLMTATIRRVESEPTRRFRVDWGVPQLQKLMGGELFSWCSKLVANYEGPRLNPLNGRTVGSDGKWKGKVRFVSIAPDHSDVEVIVENVPGAAGDVVTGIVGESKDGRLCFAVGDADYGGELVLKTRPDSSSQPAKTK